VDSTDLTELKLKFDEACKLEDVQALELLISQFDLFCRAKVEQESELEAKQKTIESLLIVQQNWVGKISQIKAQVNHSLADIRMNSKKVHKYLTSF
jgi:hypothetical protein